MTTEWKNLLRDLVPPFLFAITVLVCVDRIATCSERTDAFHRSKPEQRVDRVAE